MAFSQARQLAAGWGSSHQERSATNQRQCEVLPWPGIPNSGACTLQASSRKPAENHAIACTHPPISLRFIGLFPPQQITTHSAINGAANCTLLESQNGCKQSFPRGLAVASINGFTLQSFFFASLSPVRDVSEALISDARWLASAHLQSPERFSRFHPQCCLPRAGPRPPRTASWAVTVTITSSHEVI